MRVINRYYTHKQVLFNKRINDNLEQQAQALFKSWFVEKPNPQWTKGSLSDIASFVGGYSYKGDELVDSSNTGMATIKNYNRSGGFKTDGFKAINPSDKVKNAQYAELFEILVAHTDLTQNAEVIGNAELVLSLGEYNKIIINGIPLEIEGNSILIKYENASKGTTYRDFVYSPFIENSNDIICSLHSLESYLDPNNFYDEFMYSEE